MKLRTKALAASAAAIAITASSIGTANAVVTKETALIQVTVAEQTTFTVANGYDLPAGKACETVDAPIDVAGDSGDISASFTIDPNNSLQYTASTPGVGAYWIDFNCYLNNTKYITHWQINAKLTASIALADIGDADLGVTYTAPVNVATASATVTPAADAGAVTYTVENGSLLGVGGAAGCTVSGAAISVNGPGSCVVTAHVAEGETYVGAASAPKTFNIWATPVTTLTGLGASVLLTDGSVDLAGKASNTGASTAYTYALSDNTAGCSVSGTVVSFTQAGACKVTAASTEVAPYRASGASDPITIDVVGIAPISITTSTSATYRNGGSAQLAASSNNTAGAKTWTSSTTGVCTVNGTGVVSFIATGSCSVTVDVASDGNYLAATSSAWTVNVHPQLTVYAVTLVTATNASTKAARTAAVLSYLRRYSGLDTLDSDVTFRVVNRRAISSLMRNRVNVVVVASGLHSFTRVSTVKFAGSATALTRANKRGLQSFLQAVLSA